MFHRAVALVVCFTAIGCGTERDPAADDTVPSGGPIAELNWTLVEELRIGEGNAPDVRFGRIAGVEVDEDGEIYVLDEAQVRVFDQEGHLVRDFGGVGEGPGELSQSPGPLFLDAEGNLVLFDLPNQRFVSVTTEGEAVGVETVSLMDGVPIRWGTSGDRAIFQQIRPVATGGTGGDVLVVRGPGGVLRDTVLTLEGSGGLGSEGDAPELSPFAEEAVWTVLDDGRLVIGLNSAYRLEVRDLSGDVAALIQRDVPEPPDVSADQEVLREHMRDVLEAGGAPAEMISEMAELLRFEGAPPVLAEVMGGVSGTIWVRSVDWDMDLSEEVTRAEGLSWDVFDADGLYLGVLEMPLGFSPEKVSGDRLYGVHQDEFGVQSVVRFRVDGSSGATP